MRIAIVTESFLPALNGVTTSVCKVIECLHERGHQACVIAPGVPKIAREQVPATYAGAPVYTVSSVAVRQFRVGLPSTDVEVRLRQFQPDVVHAAAPFVAGMRGMLAARAMEIPVVAIYQTDMPSYIKQHAGPAGTMFSEATWRWIKRIHSLAHLTLAPSSAALSDLTSHGVPRSALWGRGVDGQLFHPRWRTDPRTLAMRERLAPGGETLIGYVGRLAPEKELPRLAELADLPGTRMVVVGDGPSRAGDEVALPHATFLGRKEGEELARSYAMLDVFVHTGTRETFGQTLQEASATGLPVVAPAKGGPLDIVRVGETGYLFDPEQPGSLRSLVEPLIGPDAATERERLGSNGRDQVANRSWGSLVDQLIGHYESVL